MTEPTNLVVLDGPQIEPDEDVVKILRHMLEMAESGRLRGLVAVGQLSDDSLLSMSTGTYGPITMLGQLELAKRMVVDKIE